MAQELEEACRHLHAAQLLRARGVAELQIRAQVGGESFEGAQLLDDTPLPDVSRRLS